MDEHHSCESCSASRGCTSRHTEEQQAEEIGAGAFLLIAGVIIVLLSAVFKWLF
ncbi:MAG: hypothetical protein V2B18_06540 [Pseudomonadota bacterium]